MGTAGGWGPSWGIVPGRSSAPLCLRGHGNLAGPLALPGPAPSLTGLLSPQLRLPPYLPPMGTHGQGWHCLAVWEGPRRKAPAVSPLFFLDSASALERSCFRVLHLLSLPGTASSLPLRLCQPRSVLPLPSPPFSSLLFSSFPSPLLPSPPLPCPLCLCFFPPPSLCNLSVWLLMHRLQVGPASENGAWSPLLQGTPEDPSMLRERTTLYRDSFAEKLCPPRTSPVRSCCFKWGLRGEGLPVL